MTIDFSAYAAAYGRNRAINPAVLARLVEGGRLEPGSSVLEVGCGTANYLRAVVEASSATGSGIDPAEGMLAVAEADPGSIGLILQQGSAENLPFPEASFDLVFSVDVMHHVGDRTVYAAEAYRVLKPGGRLCAATDSHDDLANRVPLASHFPETVAHELKRYPSIDTITSELIAAGFAEAETEHVAYDYALTNIAPYRDRAYSTLRLLTDDQFRAGLTRLERDLAKGPLSARSLYTLILATKPVNPLES